MRALGTADAGLCIVASAIEPIIVLRHEEAEELDFVAEWGNANRDLDKVRFSQRRLVMREGVEPDFAVVLAHSRVSKSAESHMVVR